MFKEEKNGLRSQEKPGDREAKEKGESEIPDETVLDKSSNKEQCVYRTDSGQSYER